MLLTSSTVRQFFAADTAFSRAPQIYLGGPFATPGYANTTEYKNGKPTLKSLRAKGSTIHSRLACWPLSVTHKVQQSALALA